MRKCFRTFLQASLLLYLLLAFAPVDARLSLPSASPSAEKRSCDAEEPGRYILCVPESPPESESGTTSVASARLNAHEAAKVNTTCAMIPRLHPEDKEKGAALRGAPPGPYRRGRVTAPVTGTGSITPPNTGDAGLASSSSNAMLFVIVGAAAFVLAGIASVSYARR